MDAKIYIFMKAGELDYNPNPLCVGCITEATDIENIYDLCNWGCWSEEKPQNVNIPFDYCNSYDIIAEVENDGYYVFATSSTERFNSLNEASEYCYAVFAFFREKTLQQGRNEARGLQTYAYDMDEINKFITFQLKCNKERKEQESLW